MAGSSYFDGCTWRKLPHRGAVAPGPGQYRLRSWPDLTESRVAKKCHPKSEISDSFPSHSSSGQTSSSLSGYHLSREMSQATFADIVSVTGLVAEDFPTHSRWISSPSLSEGCSIQQQNIPHLAVSHTKS